MPEPKFNREDHLKAREQGSLLSDIGEHLEELRTVLFISVLVILIAFSVAFYFSEHLINLLKTLAPVGSSFFQLKPGELFLVSIKVSFFAALYFAIPFLMHQVYLFVEPALKKKEKSLSVLVVIMAPLLFWGGLTFAFFFLLPPLLDFLLNFREGVVEKRYGLESYINLVLSIETVTAISFQLPVVIFVMGILGLVKVKQLVSVWRYVILFAFILAAFLTPTPDPLTMSVLACALLVLYFSTILVLKLFKK
jgi:sec-independent protein translocase protein TatC